MRTMTPSICLCLMAGTAALADEPGLALVCVVLAFLAALFAMRPADD